jgi:hypothetical protein
LNRWLLFLFSLGMMSIAFSPLTDTYFLYLFLGLAIAIPTAIPLILQFKAKYLSKSEGKNDSSTKGKNAQLAPKK